MTCICLHTPRIIPGTGTVYFYPYHTVPGINTVPGRQLYEDFIYLLAAVFSMLNPPTSSSSFSSSFFLNLFIYSTLLNINYLLHCV